MLDENTAFFLKFLIKKEALSLNDYLDYCFNNNFNKLATINMFEYLYENKYIKRNFETIMPTYKAIVEVNEYNKGLYNQHVLPYIQQAIFFIAGTITSAVVLIMQIIVEHHILHIY